MCGIVGYLSLDGESAEVLVSMANSLNHRGPDDEGYLLLNFEHGEFLTAGGAATPAHVYTSQHSYRPQSDVKTFASRGEMFNLALVSRRLAIIDLSAAGHMPMTNEKGDVWIIHNGEVYNHEELRRELSANHVFQSRTDTEVILHAYEEWGVDCLARFNGMWAFAIWDGRRKTLFCSRDRFGIKPLYYYRDGRRFIFASEIKAILKAPGIVRQANDAIVHDYLVRGLVDHTEETFFTGIRRLLPGHYLKIVNNAGPEIKRYYDIPMGRKLAGLKETEYAERFLELFKDSVRLRLISDVPVGTCLSGGLDSSSVVCTMDLLMRQNGVKIPGSEGIQKTFSACYEDFKLNELPFIEEVKKKAVVESHLVYPTGERLLRDMEKLVWHQEEPFGGTSVYAQWEVFRLFREHRVTVALDGQGADELLAGYPYYFFDLFADLMRQGKCRDLRREYQAHKRLHSGKGTALLIAVLKLLPSPLATLVRRGTGTGDGPWLKREFLEQHLRRDPRRVTNKTGFLDASLYQDATAKLLPSELRFEDKNSMAHSIEARLPFLDYRLVEFIVSIPWQQIIFSGETKYVLRQSMKGIVPEAIRNRHDKIGFATPQDVWLRTSLKGLAEGVVNSESFRSRPYFVAERAKAGLKAYLEGKANDTTAIWSGINLELWFRAFVD